MLRVWFVRKDLQEIWRAMEWYYEFYDERTMKDVWSRKMMNVCLKIERSLSFRNQKDVVYIEVKYTTTLESCDDVSEAQNDTVNVVKYC